jgi:uncharacterized protein
MAERLAADWDFIILFILLGGIIPWRGAVRIAKLLARPQLTLAERIATYASTILLQWSLAALVAWRCVAHGISSRELGLAAPNGPLIAAVAVVMSALFATLQWFAARQARWSSNLTEARSVAIALRLMPQATLDSAVFVALVITAGVCEEFLYRGFIFAVLVRAAGVPVAVLGSSLLFSLAHLYQGARGLASTFILGLLLAASRVWTASLLPATVAHMAVDLAAGFVTARYLRRLATQAAPPAAVITI